MNNQYRKKKKSSQVIVVSMMCTVLVSIVGQSINIAVNPAQKDSVQAASFQQVHEVASEQPSGFLNNNLNTRVNKQKDQVNDRLSRLSGGEKTIASSSKPLENVKKSQGSQGFEVHRDEPHTHTEPEGEKNVQGDYVPFYMLQTSLKEKSCDYRLPIDADPPLITMLQWALDHCIITVSSSYKVYPHDYLTHNTMRIMAERAGFVVKMEYASNDIVTNSQLLSFLNALQQHHQISDIPSILVGERVTRREYIKILYLLFNDTTVDKRDNLINRNNVKEQAPEDVGDIRNLDDIAGQLSKIKIRSSTLQQEENMKTLLPIVTSLSDQTISAGKDMLGEYVQNKTTNIPDELKNQLLNYVNKSWADNSHPTKELNESIGLNTQAIQATWVQIQQWLGRS